MARKTERRRNKTAPKRTVTKAAEFKKEADKFFNGRYKNEITRKSYREHYHMFVDFCRKNYKSETHEECAAHIQDYADWLRDSGKSASTIHTYIAPVCIYHSIKMQKIEKPQRKVSEVTRSRKRENKYSRPSQQYDNPRYSLAAEFQSRVGIRRAELKNLRLDALKQDESGYWCIEVRRGKGGKYQLQRILPEDVEFIRSYFQTAESTEKLFKDSDFSDEMDYHHLRALQAQRAYRYYYTLTHNEDGTENKEGIYKLRGELMARWRKYNIGPNGTPRKFPLNQTKGVYKLRSDNRRYAIEHGLPVEYDRLCVMAVSVFHLSHWRLNTLCNYLIAV